MRKNSNPVPPQNNLLNTPTPAQPASAPTPQQGPRPFTFSIAEFCNGAIIGLVCITPAAGYVPHQIAPLFLWKIGRRRLPWTLGCMTALMLVINVIVISPAKVFIYFKF